MDVRVLNEVDEGDNSKDNDLNFTEESCQFYWWWSLQDKHNFAIVIESEIGGDA
jgi:hypothetical protein